MLSRFKKKITRITSAIACFIFMISVVPITALAETTKDIPTTSTMTTEVGSVYSGFKFIEEKPLDDVVVKTFVHEKTGAKVTYFENDDENKAFSIGFKTPPVDNTGANHIIEHSLFGGSQRFPVKDLLSRLPSSLRCLFLNAFTYSDATIYPVASKYDKDFRALMDIYMDMAFNPKMLEDENIFKREGWRYELNSKDDELKINGIVYNEMKGHYSQPDGMLMQNEIYKSLFPDTCYKYQSGGYPDDIPDLSYEHLKDVYKKYYTPSNANIVLYGKMDILETLKFINDTHLSKFSKEKVDAKIELQKPFKTMVETEAEFNIPKDTSPKDKSIMMLNYVVDTRQDRESFFTLKNLQSLLYPTLSKALEDADFKGELNIQVFETLQPVLSIILKNIDKSEKEKYEKIIKTNLSKLATEGIDKETLDNYLLDSSEEDSEESSDESSDQDNKDDIFMDFTWVKYFIQAQICLNYDLDCIEYFNEKDLQDEICASIKRGDKYFEKYIQEKLLNNTHCSLIMLNPKPGLDEKNSKTLKKKLASYKASLTDKEVEDLVLQTEAFKKWNNTPLTQEQIATIPTADIKDHDVESKKQERQEKLLDDVKLLYYPTEKDEDMKLNMYFNTHNIPQDKLNYLKLYTSLINKTNLKNYSKESFEKLCEDEEIFLNASQYNVRLVSPSGDFIPMFKLNGYFKADKADTAVKLLEEMIFNIDYADTVNIKQTINDEIESMEQILKFTNSGILLSLNSVLSSFLDVSKYDGPKSTEEYLKFLKIISKDFENEWPSVLQEIHSIEDNIFNKENAVMSFSSKESHSLKMQESLKTFVKNLDTKPFVNEKYEFTPSDKNIAYIENNKGVSVIQGGNFDKYGYKFNGTMNVSNTILKEYLTNTVRVQGGAYSVDSSIDEYGTLIMLSMNDAHIKETLKYYQGAAEFFKNLNLSQKELNKYISTTVEEIDAQLELFDLMDVSSLDERYLAHMDDNYLEKTRAEILKTTVDDIHKFGEILEKILCENNYSASGNKEIIMDNKDLFDKIIDLDDDEKLTPEQIIEELQKKITRIDGKDRYETAANVCSTTWQEADTAILCYGENFADELSAVCLSKQYDAPILLTDTDMLHPSTKATLQKLNAKHVIILGGQGIISENVEKTITDMGISTERIFGKDRYETSLKVSQKLDDVQGIVLTTGKDYAEGLSMATYAANNHMAVLLVDHDTMSEDMMDYIKFQNTTKVYYAASKESIGENVMNILPNGIRFYDENKYQENVDILNYFHEDLDYENVYVVTGEDFADALSAATVAVKTNSPMVFMNNIVENSTREYLKNIFFDTDNFIIVGSEGALSQETLEEHFK